MVVVVVVVVVVLVGAVVVGFGVVVADVVAAVVVVVVGGGGAVTSRASRSSSRTGVVTVALSPYAARPTAPAVVTREPDESDRSDWKADGVAPTAYTLARMRTGLVPVTTTWVTSLALGATNPVTVASPRVVSPAADSRWVRIVTTPSSRIRNHAR